MPSPRYTVRLPEPLHTHVQAYLETTRTPFVTLIREALSAYLADKMPPGVPTFADSTDPLTALQDHVTELTARVKVIEDILTTWPQHADTRADRSADINADRTADTAPTGADSYADSDADTVPTGRGQRKLTPRQVRALRDKRHRGVSIEALMEEYALSRASVFRYLQSEKR